MPFHSKLDPIHELNLLSPTHGVHWRSTLPILPVFHRPSLPSIGELNVEGWEEENLKHILHMPASLNHFPLNYLSTNETPSLGFWGQGLSMESSLLPWSSLLA